MSAFKPYPVTLMQFHKTKISVEHKFLIFQVPQRDDTQDYHQWILEWTVLIPTENPDNKTINKFFDHHDSKKLLNSVLKTIESVLSPSSIAVAAAVTAIPTLGPASILPLALTSAILRSDLCLPLTNEGVYTSSHLLHTSHSVSLEYSIINQASMAMAEVLQVVSESKVGYYMSKSLDMQNH